VNRIAAKCLEDAELLGLANGEPPGEETAAHLQSCSSCAGKLDEFRSQITAIRDAELDQEALAGDNVPPARPRGAPAMPKSVGNYQIIEELGSGGQARVYRAMHPTLKCDVVLKVGHDAVPQADQSDDRIVREARLLKDLRHPNLAQVHDLFFADDRPVLVLDFVRGRSLRQVSREKRLAPRQAAALIATIARALQGAHVRGIFHRDITPGNIMLDEKGQPRLIDFGLARYRHAWGESLEAAGWAAGTIGYMPPEQYAGLHDEIDARTDVYALGAVLRAVLKPPPGARVMEPPATVRDGITAPPGEGCATVETTESSDPLREARIPRQLRRIIEKATRPEKPDRYASAAELAAALERFVKGPRWPLWLGIGAAIAGAVVLTLMALGFFREDPIPPVRQSLLYQLVYPDQEATYPLHQTVDDFLKVDVPHGSVPVMTWIDPDAYDPNASVEVHKNLRHMNGGTAPFDRYEFWRNTGNDGFTLGHNEPNIAKPAGQEWKPDKRGWKLILVVALPRGAGEPEINQLKTNLRSLLPKNELPMTVAGKRAFRFGASDAEPGAAGGGVQQFGSIDRGTAEPPISAEENAVRAWLEQFQSALRQKGYHFFTGIAVPYMPDGT
jgi:serine/threonine-protein kinase